MAWPLEKGLFCGFPLTGEEFFEWNKQKLRRFFSTVLRIFSCMKILGVYWYFDWFWMYFSIYIIPVVGSSHEDHCGAHPDQQVQHQPQCCQLVKAQHPKDILYTHCHITLLTATTNVRRLGSVRNCPCKNMVYSI